MPELHFSVKWPDGSIDSCYSPSTVIRDYFEVGKSYSLQEFLNIAGEALQSASDRVEQKFGYHCSSAMDQLSIIRHKAGLFASQPDNQIVVTEISP